jgi:hypothetical protein
VGLGAPKPLEPVKGFISLCHAVCVTLSDEWTTVLHPLAGVASRSPLALGARFLPGLWL